MSCRWMSRNKTVSVVAFYQSPAIFETGNNKNDLVLYFLWQKKCSLKFFWTYCKEMNILHSYNLQLMDLRCFRNYAASTFIQKVLEDEQWVQSSTVEGLLFWRIKNTLSFIIRFDFVHQSVTEPLIGMDILQCVDRNKLFLLNTWD